MMPTLYFFMYESEFVCGHATRSSGGCQSKIESGGKIFSGLYISFMKIEALHIGMNVRHPQYGNGTVKAISESSAEILFSDGKRTVAPEAAGLEPAEAAANVSGLNMPLAQFIEETVEAAVQKLGLEKPDS